jgi:hypothetical protein
MVSIIASVTLSLHFDQASTTLLYFSPWVIRPSMILLFEIGNLILDLAHDGPFRIRDDHVVLAERNAGLERFAEAKTHDLVAEDDRLFLTAIAVDGVDDGLHVLLAQQAVDQFERRLGVQRQKVPKPQTAGGGVETLPDFVAGLRRPAQRALILACRCTAPAASACSTSRYRQRPCPRRPCLCAPSSRSKDQGPCPATAR